MLSLCLYGCMDYACIEAWPAWDRPPQLPSLIPSYKQNIICLIYYYPNYLQSWAHATTLASIWHLSPFTFIWTWCQHYIMALINNFTLTRCRAVACRNVNKWTRAQLRELHNKLISYRWQVPASPYSLAAADRSPKEFRRICNYQYIIFNIKNVWHVIFTHRESTSGGICIWTFNPLRSISRERTIC